MPEGQCIEILGEWKGYREGSCQRFEAKGERQAEVWIELLPKAGRRMVCSGCRRTTDRIHDSQERWIRDLPILDAQTQLLVWRCRVDCPRCGPRLEVLDWLPPYSRVTRRLATSVARLCEVLPIKQVAEHFDVSWHAVKKIDKEYLSENLGPPDLSGIEVLATDEFAIEKGHRYATVVIEPCSREVLWVGRGRDRDSIRPFFDLLGPERCGRIQAVAMDMNAAYELEVRDHCPKAKVVYDLFHVVAKYGREVIDRVRVDEANRVRNDKKARKVIKGSRWLLLRNPENTRDEDRVRLQELLKANRKLMTAYLLKEDLKHLWDYSYEGAAKRFWRQWYSRAIRSRIEPLKKFARRLKGYLSGILSHCRWPLNTSVLEGINNKIKVIKRRACGFRDDDYFFLKIRQAFPGIHRST